MDKSGIIEFFLVEAGEHMQNLNKGLLALEKDPSDKTMIDELFRAAHTLKGSAAMMGFQGVSDVAHKAEDMLGMFRSGSIPIAKETLNFLFDSVDAVKVMVDGIAANQPEDRLVVDTMARAYKDVVAAMQTSAGRDLSLEEEAPTSRPAPAAPAAPAVSKPAAPAPSVSSDKDDLDLAWERTFDHSWESAAPAAPAKPAAPAAPAASKPAPPSCRV